jgi:hypothetical protein
MLACMHQKKGWLVQFRGGGGGGGGVDGEWHEACRWLRYGQVGWKQDMTKVGKHEGSMKTQSAWRVCACVHGRRGGQRRSVPDFTHHLTLI